jgi:ATP-dependent DNA helicase DinG
MLTDTVKEQIQSAYRQLLASRNLTPRYGQRQMIAEIARALGAISAAHELGTTDTESGSSADETPAPVCVIEAGTGTGKTLAYLLASIPVAAELNLKVVIATATVALQEQVVEKDIPELLQGSDLHFSYALAKGRGRYVCLARLDQSLRGGDSAQAMADLYGEELDVPGEGNHQLYADMLNALSAGDWEGDRDDWASPILDSDWRPVTVDNAQCSGPKCSHFRNCCFYRARDALNKADCIVTNHDLVLSDLALGGGVILPAPEESIYIFDEAHHLPLKSNNHFSSFTQVRGTSHWLERSEALIDRLRKDDFIDGKQQKSLLGLLRQCRQDLNECWVLLEQIILDSDSTDQYESRRQHTFAAGIIPEAIKPPVENLSSGFGRLHSELQRALDEVKDALDDDATSGNSARALLAEQWFPLLGSMVKRAEGNYALFSHFAMSDPEGRAPQARWLSYLEREGSDDITMSVSPVLAADNLQESLWSRCAAAILTSATLSALGNFDMLALRAGLPAHTRYLSIPSPFDFAGAARLIIPRLDCEPTDNQGHTRALVKAIPQILKPEDAALMLFSSRRQMLDVLAGLPGEWQERVLCQDDYQKSQLLKYHRQRIDQGQGSLIFGLASFAEGVDLPGKYCTHVLIAKIPFAVPNDPIEMTLSNWIEQQGKNAFTTLAVPDAAFRLVQATGRLLRSETDRGQIYLFDERLVSRRYGKQILASLPPYTQELLQLKIDSSAS